MKALPLFTIAIPTYNRSDSYLLHALRSAVNQTYTDIDIVVSDNASSDNTESLFTDIRDPRIRYFRHSKNIGPNNNYNFCFEKAKGRYVLLLHDDDMIDADLLEASAHAIRDSKDVGIIRSGTRFIDSAGNILGEVTNPAAGLSTEAFLHAWFSGTAAIYMCSTLFHTERLKEIGGFQSKHHCYQDTTAVLKLAAQYGRADIPEVKASFRLHEGELTWTRKIDEWCEDSLALLDVMCDLAPNARERIRDAGLVFFSKVNYHRASALQSPLQRCIAYGKVMRYFKYRQLPSPSFILDILYGTRLYNAMRSIKHGLRYVTASQKN